MRTVYKYALDDSANQIPHSAKLVHAGLDPNGVMCAWFEIDTENSPSTVIFMVFGTGHELTRGAKHIISVIDGPFVWHWYAVGLA
jgi:hypothetical protein